MPKVSVIVPIYNVEKYLKRCLDSIVNQTLEDIEIILVNDGSTDKSGAIAKEYKNKYTSKIKYYEKENSGLSDTRNYGITKANGEYIVFLDSDDYIEVNAYNEMYSKAKEENLDYIECDFLWEYPNKKKKDIIIKYNNAKEMLSRVRVVAWNKMIKRKIIIENNIKFPEKLRYEDVEFTYKLIPYIKRMGYINKTFIHYIQRNGSIIKVQNEKNMDIFVVLENVEKYYKEKNFYEKYKEELEYNYTRYLLCSSLKRICKIKNKKQREKLISETWNRLNDKYPNWRKNKILNLDKTNKNKYMKTVNRFTYKIYTQIFKIL